MCYLGIKAQLIVTVRISMKQIGPLPNHVIPPGNIYTLIIRTRSSAISKNFIKIP